MFGFCCKRFQLLVPSCSTAFDYRYFQIRSFSSKSSFLGSEIIVDDDKPQEQGRSITVSYLINSFGFSPELALSLSKKQKRVLFNTRQGPDSVLNLLKHYGFNDAQISQLVWKEPKLISFNAQKTLLPKLEFFGSIGISGTDLTRLVCVNPSILRRSLERSLRPSYDIIKTLCIPNEKLPYFFSNFRGNVERLRSVARNIPVLKAHGVPECSFPLWVPHHLNALACGSDKVEANVKRVTSMGLHPSSTTFMKALYVMFVMDASKWEQEMEFYKKWGWTEDDVLLAFRKNPLFMSLSEKNISGKLDYYLNTMGCQPADLAGHPDFLTYSLEKRIIPRCSVIRLFQSKGIIVKQHLSTILKSSDKWFLKTFVIKYQEEVPELLGILQGKFRLAKFGLGLDGRGGVKQL